MGTFVVDGDVWGVVRVPVGDPRLIDRTGTARLATADPSTFTVCVSDAVRPPLLDKVVLHEVAHAVTISRSLLPELRSEVMRGDMAGAEEWAARLVENYSIEALEAARSVLGRPVCVRGLCHG